MTFMTWNDHFTTGIAIVDQQHRGLVDLVNEAAPALAAASRENLDGVEDLLDRLTDYAASHFCTEEALMANYGIDARHFQHHRQSHAAFTRQIAAMGRSLLTGGLVTGNEMLTFLANWLIFHILGEDQAMAHQIKYIATGETPTQAFKEGGTQNDPAHGALTQSMVDLYTLLGQQNRELLEANTRLETTQAELLQSERYHRVVVESLVEGVIVQDTNGCITMSNPAAERILGLTHEQMLGRSSLDPCWQALHEDGRPFPNEAHPSMVALTTGEPQRDVIMGIHQPDGTLVWLSINSQPIFKLQDRQPSAVVVSFADITARRQAETELANYRLRLEDLVRDRTLQLEMANMELAQARDIAEMASRVKSTFLTTMSHEIRTPMNAIIGFAHLLEQARLEPRLHSYAHLINEAANRLLGIVNDVLEFSRIDAGGVTVRQSEFGVWAVLDVIYADLNTKGLAKGLQVFRDYDPALPRRLYGDPLCLERILRQLASNALKFTDQGSVTFRTRVEAVGERQLCARFIIEDTGIGIHPDQQTRLFQPFEQADSSLSRRHGGMGLGLAIAHRLAQLMSGEVGVESQLGVGSRFWLTLPLRPPMTATTEPQNTPPATAQNLTPAAVHQWQRQMEALLIADDLRAQQVFTEGAAWLSEALGVHVETFAQQMADYQYQDALRTLRAAMSSAPPTPSSQTQ